MPALIAAVQVGPLRGDAREHRESAVAAAVVDTDDLVRAAQLRQLAEELVQKRLDVLLLVE